MSESQTYIADREDRWAASLFEAMRPDLVVQHGWAAFRNTQVGQSYLILARAALAKHLECCEQRCKTCNERLVHQCMVCNRA